MRSRTTRCRSPRLRPAPERRGTILLRGSRHKLEIRQGSSSRSFDGWYGTEEFGLQLRIGDVLSRLEVPAHGHHVAHERKEQAPDRADGLEHEQRTNARFHHATEEPREDVREFDGGDGAVRSEVDPASDRTGVVDREREVSGNIV